MAAALLACTLACGERGVVGEMHRAFDKGDYDEVIALGRHTLRSDSSQAGVQLYYGMALVAKGRLHEGFVALERAAVLDAETAKTSAEFLSEQGRNGPMNVSSARKLAKAAELDPALDLGKRRFSVADVYFTERRYDEAARMYEEAVRLYPDTSACEVALANLSECYANMGRPEDARETMERWSSATRAVASRATRGCAWMTSPTPRLRPPSMRGTSTRPCRWREHW